MTGLTLLRRAMHAVIGVTSLHVRTTHAYDSLEDITVLVADHSQVRYARNRRPPPCVSATGGDRLAALALWSLQQVRRAGALGDLPKAWSLTDCLTPLRHVTVEQWDAVYGELDAAYTIQYQMLVPMLYRLGSPVT